MHVLRHVLCVASWFFSVVERGLDIYLRLNNACVTRTVSLHAAGQK